MLRGLGMKRISVSKNNKGFTLVELIVVLVILAILAALLIPALLGYIDRAKNQQYIVEAKEVMRATQAGIVEAYAQEKESFKQSVRGGDLKKNGYVSENYGCFTNGWAGLAMAGQAIDVKEADPGNLNGGRAKAIICNKLVNYLEKNNLKVATEPIGANKKASEFKNKGRVFFVAYNERGQIIYMQYAVDGKMVTFDGKSFSVEEDGKFVTYTNVKIVPPTPTPKPSK